MMQWADWLPDVSPHVAGCPNVVVTHELLRSAQEFCTRTRVWRADTAPLTLPAGTGTLEIDVPDGAALLRVESVTLGGWALPESTVQNIEARDGENWRTQTGTPLTYTQITPGELIFYPVPTEDQTVIVRLSLTPSDDASGLPDALLSAAAAWIRPAVIAGAKSRLMLYPGSAWENPTLAVALGAEFNTRCDEVANRAAHGFGRAPVRSLIHWC